MCLFHLDTLKKLLCILCNLYLSLPKYRKGEWTIHVADTWDFAVFRVYMHTCMSNKTFLRLKKRSLKPLCVLEVSKCKSSSSGELKLMQNRLQKNKAKWNLIISKMYFRRNSWLSLSDSSFQYAAIRALNCPENIRLQTIVYSLTQINNYLIYIDSTSLCTKTKVHTMSIFSRQSVLTLARYIVTVCLK